MKPNPRRLANKTLILWIASMLTAGVALALNPDEWRHTQDLSVPKAGLARINLTASTLDAAQPDLSDLRLLDPGGSEVSYLIERPMPQPETAISPQEFHSALDTGSNTTVTLRTGSILPLAAVEFVTPASRLIKSVKVEISTDGLSWSEIAASRPIFRLPGGAENLRIDFPANIYPWLRLTIDDRRDEPIPINTARLISPPSEGAPSDPLPITIKSRDESPGATRISIDLGAANLPLASLRIETGSPLFTRSVSVAEQEMQDGVVTERTLDEAVIYRVDLDGSNRQCLDIPIEHTIETRELLLLIHNQDSPPLAIDGVEGTRREVHALFYAAAPGKYTLLTGNDQCAAPHYDLAGLSEQLKSTASAILQPGPLADNPRYRIPAALGSLSLQGAAIDPGKWRYRKSLPVKDPGAQQVELDQDVLAHAAPVLSDIRIVQADHQIPYVLERTSITRTVPLSVTQKKDPDHPSHSVWVLKLPQPGLPLASLICTSSSPLFQRTIRLSEEVQDERGETYSRELGGANWNRTPDDPQPSLALKFDSEPQTGTLYLDTDNGDNAAIELCSFNGDYAVTRVVFKATGDSTQPVWLYYGNPDAQFPSYDVRLIAGDLLRAERHAITAGPQEATGGAAGSTSEALTGASRYLFWGALLLVVVVLLAVTAKLLPKAD